MSNPAQSTWISHDHPAFDANAPPDRPARRCRRQGRPFLTSCRRNDTDPAAFTHESALLQARDGTKPASLTFSPRPARARDPPHQIGRALPTGPGPFPRPRQRRSRARRTTRLDMVSDPPDCGTASAERVTKKFSFPVRPLAFRGGRRTPRVAALQHLVACHEATQNSDEPSHQRVIYRLASRAEQAQSVGVEFGGEPKNW